MDKKLNGELKIESGIKIPSRSNKKGFTSAVRQLKRGESVLLPTSIQSAITICYQTKLPRDVFTRRREGSGTRVWRIK